MAEAEEGLSQDPGAARFGNFINYYTFRPTQERIDALPENLVESDSGACVALDVGCNSGELTVALRDFLCANSGGREVEVIGVDLDGVLVERARRLAREGLSFEVLDVTADDAPARLGKFLGERGRTRFDVVFCFSVTMWIHLNRGDGGLESALATLRELCDVLVVEPQPWKCYRAAARRATRAGLDFPLRAGLRMGPDVEAKIIESVTEDGRYRVTDDAPSSWGRRVLVFRRGQ